MNGVHTNGVGASSDTYKIPSSYHLEYAEDSIPPSEFRQRVETVRSALKPAGLLGLISFGDCWRGANVCYFTEFRPLDGVSDIANAVVFIGDEGDDSEPILFVSAQCVDYARSCTTFSVAPFTELRPRLSSFVAKCSSGGGKVALAGEAYIPADLLRRIDDAFGPQIDVVPHPILAEIKAIKSDREIALLRKASLLTDAAMEAIKNTLADGKSHSERELAVIADRAMLVGGADRTAYDSMVQTGPRSAYNLARPTDRIVQPGDLVMTDIGARYRGYVADGGRGFIYKTEQTTPERRAIVRAAALAVEAGLKAAKPGITAADLNKAIQAALVESGFEKHSSEARGHGTGHGTGMDPEEEQPWIGPTNKTILRENMVFTLKATITVPGVGGLRTERIVRLSRDGVEPLDKYPMELYW